jgi:hypothetical protein
LKLNEQVPDIFPKKTYHHLKINTSTGMYTHISTNGNEYHNEIKRTINSGICFHPISGYTKQFFPLFHIGVKLISYREGRTSITSA